jgi:cytochrome c peroxidase
MKRTIIYTFCGLIFAGSFACKKEEQPKTEAPKYTLETPAHFPPMIPFPDNALTAERVALGKRLFYDPLLSANYKVSCGTCHLPEKAMTDGLPLSTGIEGRKAARNSMPIFNLAYQNSFFWDGGIPTLERQVLGPIENPNEMGNRIDTVIARLKRHPEYPALFDKAYGEGVTVSALTRAIAAFERTLISGNSAYDRYITGKDTNALLPQQKLGMKIFFGEKAECFHCHTGVLFTDLTFQNNGLYDEYRDQGRYLITARERDKGKFRVPSLRNIALTAPYMHDGSLKTLDEVIDHYRSGGKNHPNKSPQIRKIRLSEEEKQYLISFLEALTDTGFVAKAR